MREPRSNMDSPRRRILVTGISGQVGFELLRALQGLADVAGVDRTAVDLCNLDSVRAIIRSFRPNIIVNPAAYTAVDKAESEAELAMLINGRAPAVIAEEAKAIGAAVVHYSTDYVFSGESRDPYVETDQPDPRNVYGLSKLEGEQAVASIGVRHLIFRTSWVYGKRGKNFLLTMQRLAREKSELSVVADQYGAPTWSRTIAEITGHVLAIAMSADAFDADEWWSRYSGIYHLTASGSASWHQFATAILRQSDGSTLVPIKPISTREYPTPAVRPQNSRLCNDKLRRNFGICPPEWSDALGLCLAS